MKQNPNPTIEIAVEMTDQVRNVCASVIRKYREIIQKPESFTCENPVAPAAMATVTKANCG